MLHYLRIAKLDDLNLFSWHLLGPRFQDQTGRVNCAQPWLLVLREEMNHLSIDLLWGERWSIDSPWLYHLSNHLHRLGLKVLHRIFLGVQSLGALNIWYGNSQWLDLRWIPSCWPNLWSILLHIRIIDWRSFCTGLLMISYASTGSSTGLAL